MPDKLSSLLVLVFLALTVACGDSGGGGAPSDGPMITVTGTVQITGDKMASGGFTRTLFTHQPSCAAYAAEGAGADDPVGAEGWFIIPGPVVGVPLEPTGDVYASTLKISAAVYKGPGTYVNNDTVTQLQGQIVLEEIPDGPNYYLDDGISMAIINSDGSGSVTFDNIPEDNVENPTFISGTIMWTCTEAE